MRFEEVPAPRLQMRIRRIDGESFGFDSVAGTSKGKKAQSIYVESLKTTHLYDRFELYTKDAVFFVVPVNSADINNLSSMLNSGRTFLFQLTDPAPDGSAELHLLLFFGEPVDMNDLEIGIDDNVLAALSSKTKEVTFSEAVRIMHNKCVLTHGDKEYFFVVAGYATKSYLEGDDTPEEEPDTSGETDESEKARENADAFEQDLDNLYPEEEEEEENAVPEIQTSGSRLRNFAILGSDVRFVLAEQDKGRGRTIFLATRITRFRTSCCPLKIKGHYREETALRLVCGNLQFENWTEIGASSQQTRDQMDRLTNTVNSYLRKWDEFGTVEGQIFLENARAAGIIPFTVIGEDKDGIVVRCVGLTDKQTEQLRNISELDFVSHDNLPEILVNQNMTSDEFADALLKKEQDKFFDTFRRKDRQEEENTYVQVIDFNPATGELHLNTQSVPVGKDLLIYSISGERAQIMRRYNARKAIQAGRAANPNLGLLIEDGGVLPQTQQIKRRMPALTAYVKEKVFPNHPPTPAQQLAIEVALNTPDIALIQGPPGTGKTTVIAAIIERLNQECDKRKGLNGRVLLTGFQHDAVMNMIERMNINGLPVPKFGGRRSGDDQNADFTVFEKKLMEWCRERRAQLQEKNPRIMESMEENSLRVHCFQYLNAPSLKQAIDLLERALNISVSTIGEDLYSRLQKEQERLIAELNSEHADNPLLNVVRGLRTQKASFLDDGPDRAADILYRMKDELNSEDKELLVKASGWQSKTEPPPFLNQLNKLKGRFLTRLTPPPEFRVEKVRDSVFNLIQETLEMIRKNGLNSRDRKTAALAELLMEMESNLSGIMETVRDYSFAFAATCQQSVNKMMQRMKGLSDNVIGQQMQYDYVIVDEAARVSPRDLMIPMSMGKHIILVGDHRQLPQLIDENVAARLEREQDNDCKSDGNEWLKKSMFEYLFTERLEKLKAADGILRHVTLNAQFRMHPTLGDFVSRNFYERYNREEKFESPLPDSMFAQNLSGTNGKCAVWLNVPNGAMEQCGSSWIRQSEADVICHRVKKWIEEDSMKAEISGKLLTFGVIAFYKAQSELMKRQLQKELGNQYVEYVEDRKLQIGTVDSFQGMEFDVVLLSLVRTGRESFGFLQLYNRINVSMSRQKRLLVAVGNAGYYDTPEAKKMVPGIANFLELCREKGVVEEV